MAGNICTKVLTVEEVADLLEESCVLGNDNMGSYDAIRVSHPAFGESILISATGEKHLLLHT